jgi:hypothetical protein
MVGNNNVLLFTSNHGENHIFLAALREATERVLDKKLDSKVGQAGTDARRTAAILAQAVKQGLNQRVDTVITVERAYQRVDVIPINDPRGMVGFVLREIVGEMPASRGRLKKDASRR